MKYTVDYSSLEQVTVEAESSTDALIAAQAKDADEFTTASNDWSVFETESGCCVDNEIDFDAVDNDGASGEKVQPTREQIQTNEHGEPVCRCANCAWEGTADDIGKTLSEMPNLAERLEPACGVPVGECPACGAFAYFVKAPAQTYSLAEIRNGTGFPSGVMFRIVKV